MSFIVEVLYCRLWGLHRNKLLTMPILIRKDFTGKENLALDLESRSKFNKQLRSDTGFLSKRKHEP